MKFLSRLLIFRFFMVREIHGTLEAPKEPEFLLKGIVCIPDWDFSLQTFLGEKRLFFKITKEMLCWTFVNKLRPEILTTPVQLPQEKQLSVEFKLRDDSSVLLLGKEILPSALSVRKGNFLIRPVKPSWRSMSTWFCSFSLLPPSFSLSRGLRLMCITFHFSSKGSAFFFSPHTVSNEFME